MAPDAIDERALQAAYQGWMRGARSGHLDEVAWLRLGAGDAAQSERDRLFAHIMTCADCSIVWRSVSLLRQQAEADQLIERRAPRGSFVRFLMPAAIAAVLVVVTATTVVMRRPVPVDTVARGTGEIAAVEGLMMAYASDGTPMLLWTPVAAASTYRVEIFSEDGQPLWSGEMSTPPTRWPADVPKVKGTYRWRVEAQDDGSTIARSKLMPLELTR